MSYPILYSATETDFNHNGIGILSACVSCEVTEEANGSFELVMQYPMDGIHYNEIIHRSIVMAKPDQFRDPQIFRVYSISKAMSGIATIKAEHISYDLSGIPVKPFNAENASDAFNGLKSNAVVDCPFDFWTDNSTSGSFSVPVPVSIRSRLGGSAGSVLDVYGGDYEFDNYTVKLHANRGMNRGVSIRYGKNLTNIKQDQNCSSFYTGIYPYWAIQFEGEDAFIIDLPEKVVNASGNFGFTKILTVDFSNDFEFQPTESELREKAKKYIKDNNIGVPSVSLTVSFAQLEQTEEYRHLKLLERVSLFDTVNVEFPDLGVSANAKAVKVVYDSVFDRVKSVTLGSVKANIADTISTQKQEIEKMPSKSFLAVAVENLTSTILGAKGGSVRMLDENGDGEPDTLYIADDPDPTQAVKVWRFNYEGWGASKNGYNGPFEMGATFKDGIIADFITAGTLDANNVNVTNLSADNIKSGTLTANMIKSGILNANNGRTFFNLDSGYIATKTERNEEARLSLGGFSMQNGNGKKTISLVPATNKNGFGIAHIQFFSSGETLEADLVADSGRFEVGLRDKTGVQYHKPVWMYNENIGYYIGAWA